MSARRLASVGRDALSERLGTLFEALGYNPNKEANRPLRIVGLGAGAWGSVFIAMLQQMYGKYEREVDVRLWRRPGKVVPKETITKLMNVINDDEAVLKRLRNSSVYLKYVSGRLGDRTLTADELLQDGFCLNLPALPLCPLKVITELDEAVYDADIIINGLPSTETRNVFEKVAKVFAQTRGKSHPWPVVISLSKGVETRLEPHPHIVTPTLIIHEVAGVPLRNCLYLGGPNIAAEIWRGEYATARICGSSRKLRKALAQFLRNDDFVVWTSSDTITHEVMGGLKNIYALGMGVTTAVTHDSATSKAVYFSNAAAEMVFITRLLSKHPEELQGPLLADTYVTLLKGRNAWYGERLGNGTFHPSQGDYVPGKGLIQGISAVHEFHALLSDERVKIFDRVTGTEVCPVKVLPTLCMLKEMLSTGLEDGIDGDAARSKDELSHEMHEAGQKFISRLKDASASDPARRLRTESLYLPMLTTLPAETIHEEVDDGDDDDAAIGPKFSAISAPLTSQ